MYTMKRVSYLLSLTIAMFSVLHAQSQTGTGKSFTFPSFNIIALDSSKSISLKNISQKKPVVFLFFSTTCDHCQREVTGLVKKKDKFQKVQLVMISMENLAAIKAFYRDYSLAGISNLVIGKDPAHAGISQYRFESFPYCAIYKSNHTYITSLDKEFDADDIIQELKKAGQL